MREAVADLLQRKRAGDELTEGPQMAVLNKYIEKGLERFAISARTTDTMAVPIDDLDEIFFQIATEAL